MEFHPLGLIVSVARHYAYLDKIKGEWDFTKAVNNIVHPQGRHRGLRDADNEELRNAVKGFWEQLPRNNQFILVHNGFVSFDSIAFIDDKGDVIYDYPHLYIDFHDENDPFSGRFSYLERNEHSHESLDELKQASIFPEKFPTPSCHPASPACR